MADSIAAKLRELAAGEKPYHATEQDCAENECSYRSYCDDSRELCAAIEALAVEVEAQAEKLRLAPHDISWSAVEDVADTLAAKPEETP